MEETISQLNKIKQGDLKPWDIITINGVRWGALPNLSMYLISEKNQVYAFSFSKIRKICVSVKGYHNITLTRDSKKTLSYDMHRLMAFLFIPNPEEKPDINHINGIKLDNRLENLEWCTHRENMVHAARTGLVKNTRHGEQHVNTELKNNTVSEIKTILNHFKTISYVDLAKLYNIKNNVIQSISSKISWTTISPLNDQIAEKNIIDKINALAKEGKIRLNFQAKVIPTPILQLDFNGNIINRWENHREAALATGGNESNIRLATFNSRRTAYGYKWALA